MGKNVAVFVDVANIFYAAKAAGVDIDYVTLLKAGSAGRDLVRAYAYTGLDPDNENQRNFHDFLRRNGYKVVSKDIRKYGDGKVKANLDIELVVDMMKTARNLDVAIVVSGDGDFAPAIRAVQEMGVRVEVVSFRGNTSSDLMDVADLFTDIIQIAKVEKGSSRSGRRVAGDEEDLSMTEVPDKMTEGTGERSRVRGGRGRRTSSEVSTSGARRGRPAAPVEPEHIEGGALVALPGEKLSRAAAARVAAAAAAPEAPDLEEAEDLEGADAPEGDAEGFGEDGPRRRRRRGGRGRGRSRGREENGYAEAPAAVAAASDSVPAESDQDADADDDEERPVPARRVASAFGSVWDSQIGVPASRSASRAPVDDEDFDEPAVPEYLLTERRQRDAGRGGNRGGGGRGRGGAYAAALDRERYGGGRGTTPSRFAEPSRPRESFGRNDRPDRNDRNDRGRGDRQGYRPAPAPAPRGTSDEPWSEVPPELEAMLRAQLGSKALAPRREAPAPTASTEAAAPARRGRRTGASATEASATTEAPAEPTTTRRSPARRTKAAIEAPVMDAAGEIAETAEKPARTRTTRSKATDTEATPAAAPKRTTRTRASGTTAAGTDAAVTEVADEAAAPKRRTTRKKADTAG
ncbi:MAG TPA: NYN domain-containing protein [Candidatus Limnocylindrales bacterium]|nr:NYN domain-containing protein [Candidatus Limnocylindrales bacterium]